MSLTIDELRIALNQVSNDEFALKHSATQAARVLDGRLRHVSNEQILRRLKKQLRKFNMTTGQWDE